MDSAIEGKAIIEATPKSSAGVRSKSSGKLSDLRMASKQRKKKAHRRTLRRSNTNG